MRGRLEHRIARSYAARKQAARARRFTFTAWRRSHVIFGVETSPACTLGRAGLRHTRLRNEAEDSFPERPPGLTSTQTCAALDVYGRDCCYSQSRSHRRATHAVHPRPPSRPPAGGAQKWRCTVPGFRLISSRHSFRQSREGHTETKHDGSLARSRPCRNFFQRLLKKNS